MLRRALEAGPVWALGSMSGTSLDGVDAALIRTDGETIFELGASAYRPYGEAERGVLRAAMGRWDGLDAAARLVEAAHAEVMETLPGADLVGFHGQTTAHDPGGRGTCQIGDGERLAGMLGRPVVWDFRRSDVEMGGQGAPLASFYHHACARSFASGDGPVAFLNLGGVGNLTWVDPSIADPAAAGACLAFDTGPANAPLDDLMRARLGRDRDADGALAARGRVSRRVLDRLADHEYFAKAPPKSLDRDDFAWLGDAVADLDDADAAATLTGAVAVAVSLGMGHCPRPPRALYVTGGGRLNPVMMELLAASVDCPLQKIEALGLDGDMTEAQAFGFLAVRVARGMTTSAPGTTGVPLAVGGGVVSEADNRVRQPSARHA